MLSCKAENIKGLKKEINPYVNILWSIRNNILGSAIDIWETKPYQPNDCLVALVQGQIFLLKGKIQA
jgi:hypothetical protein